VKKMFATDPDLFRTFYQFLSTILATRLKNIGSSPPPQQTEKPSSPAPKTKFAEETPVVEREEDLLFRKRFGLTMSTEIIIKEYASTHKHVTGKLYLAKIHLCFYGKVFGMKRKKVFALPNVKLGKGGKLDIDVFKSDLSKQKFTFTSQSIRDEAFDMLESLWQSCNNNLRSFRKVASVEAPSVSTYERKISQDDIEDIQDPESLTEDDWHILLQGSKRVTYNKDQAIITEGENFQRIYQIIEGGCRIEKGGKRLGAMETGQTFGEISFLLSGGASASVIADGENVEVFLLEGYFLNILFGMKPELAGRFYKYLAKTLQRRVRSREEERAALAQQQN